MSFSSPIVIGFCGIAGAGKNACAEKLQALSDHPRSRFFSLSFAYELKRSFAELTGLPFELLLGESEESREWRNQVHPDWNQTPREMLQKYGTEVGRHIHPDVWIRIVDARIRDLKDQWTRDYTKHQQGRRGRLVILLTDVRFPNEFELVRKWNGICIEVRLIDSQQPHWQREFFEAQKAEKETEAEAETARQLTELTAAAHKSEWEHLFMNRDVLVTNDKIGREMDVTRELPKVIEWLDISPFSNQQAE